MAQQYTLPRKTERADLKVPPRVAMAVQPVPVPTVPAGAPPAPNKGDPRGMEPYIREVAKRYGIDPDVAVRVAKSEGLSTFQSSVVKNGKRENSWGAFQLYTDGGLGNEFQKATGLDPSDPANEKATIDFALKRAAQGGWGPWYGAKNTGIGQYEGINSAPPVDVATGYGGVGSDTVGSDRAERTAAKTSSEDDTKVADKEDDTDKKKKSKTEAYGSAFGEALGGIGENYAKSANATKASSPTTVAPPVLPMPQPVLPTVDPRMVEAQRQQLALAMQRLNAGKLV